MQLRKLLTMAFACIPNYLPPPVRLIPTQREEVGMFVNNGAFILSIIIQKVSFTRTDSGFNLITFFSKEQFQTDEWNFLIN